MSPDEECLNVYADLSQLSELEQCRLNNVSQHLTQRHRIKIQTLSIKGSMFY